MKYSHTWVIIYPIFIGNCNHPFMDKATRYIQNLIHLTCIVKNMARLTTIGKLCRSQSAKRAHITEHINFNMYICMYVRTCKQSQSGKFFKCSIQNTYVYTYVYTYFYLCQQSITAPQLLNSINSTESCCTIYQCTYGYSIIKEAQ